MSVGKKLLGVVSILLLMLLLIFNASKNNNNTYDNEFLTSLAKGLDKRWEVIAKREYDKESLKNYRTYVDYELNELKKYKNREFENPELKKLADTYIDVLKNEKETTTNRKYLDRIFRDEWNKLQHKRYELLLDINSISEIPVQDKNSLNDILRSGEAVKEFNRVYGILVDTFDAKNFVVEEVEDGSEKEKRYVGNFENTTGHRINYIDINVSFYDENDKIYSGFQFETRYLWENGTKKSFEFSIPDSDMRFKYFKVNLGENSFRYK